MEPADLNSDSATDPLEKLLRQRAPELPDASFSARVLAALPPPQRSRSQRRWTIAAGAAAGFALFVAQAFAGPDGLSFDALGRSVENVSVLFFDPALGLGLLVTAATLLYVWRGRLRRIFV